MAGKFEARLTTWTEPAVKAQLLEYAKENGISLSEAQRRAVIAGLPLLSTPAPDGADSLANVVTTVRAVVQGLSDGISKPSGYVTFGFGQPEFFTD